MMLLLGILLVSIGLIDIFITIIYFEGSRFLSNRIQRLLWLFIRSAGLVLPLKWRYALFSFAAPLLVTVTLLFWISIEIVGFGLIYYNGMVKEEFSFWGGPHPNPLIAGVYLSSVTLPTLGFGDITPVSLLYQIITAIEALVGFAIMTLSLSYILNIYKVIQQLRVLAAELFHETSDTGNAMILIQNHWNSRLPLYIDSYFRHLQYLLLDWYENLHQYPIAYYYFSSRIQLSIPFTFKTLGALLSAHYFGTPRTQVFLSSPALESLYNSYYSITTSMLLNFVHKKFSMPAPVTLDDFKNQLREPGTTDASIKLFLQLTSQMEQFSGSEREIEAESLYKRYCQWFIFEEHVNQFTEFISRDLGYSYVDKNSKRCNTRTKVT